MTRERLVNPGRRRALAGAGAAAILGLPALAQAARGPRPVRGFKPEKLPSEADLGLWLRRLHDFGPVRATGTDGARDFEVHLQERMAAHGAILHIDDFQLTSWQGALSACWINVGEDAGPSRDVEVLSYYPFCGSTYGKAAVSGRVLHAGVGVRDAVALLTRPSADLAGSIVVLDIPAGGDGGDLMTLLQDRCMGLILCRTGPPDDEVRYQWLPPSAAAGAIPALWVGAEASRYLRRVSGKATLSMRCDARTTPFAKAQSTLALFPGDSEEVILLSASTDGPNELSGTGALGLLALATYASNLGQRRRKRTLAFALPTGAWAPAAIADRESGSGEPAGMDGMVAKHPGIAAQAVAQIALSNLGAVEAAPIWSATTAATGPARRLLAACGEARVDPAYVFPESAGLRIRAIPGLALTSHPAYANRADPAGVLGRLNPGMMAGQVAIAAKLMTLMHRLSPAKLRGEEPITDHDLYG